MVSQGKGGPDGQVDSCWLSPRKACTILSTVPVQPADHTLERVMHVTRSPRCMDREMKRHPGVRRDQSGGRLDSRVRGNDHDAASAVG